MRRALAALALCLATPSAFAYDARRPDWFVPMVPPYDVPLNQPYVYVGSPPSWCASRRYFQGNGDRYDVRRPAWPFGLVSGAYSC